MAGGSNLCVVWDSSVYSSYLLQYTDLQSGYLALLNCPQCMIVYAGMSPSHTKTNDTKMGTKWPVMWAETLNDHAENITRFNNTTVFINTGSYSLKSKPFGCVSLVPALLVTADLSTWCWKQLGTTLKISHMRKGCPKCFRRTVLQLSHSTRAYTFCQFSFGPPSRDSWMSKKIIFHR